MPAGYLLTTTDSLCNVITICYRVEQSTVGCLSLSLQWLQKAAVSPGVGCHIIEAVVKHLEDLHLTVCQTGSYRISVNKGHGPFWEHNIY